MNGEDISNIKRPETPWVFSLAGRIESRVDKIVLEDGQSITWDDDEVTTLHTPPASTCTCEESKPERQGWLIDRGRRTAMNHCEGCDAKWDRPDGPKEFMTWADGFQAGKREAINKANEIVTPEMGAWDNSHLRVAIPLEKTPGVAVESPMIELADLTIHPEAQPDTQDDIDYSPQTPATLSLVGTPDWWLPLRMLPGYKYRPYEDVIEGIVRECGLALVDHVLVMANFVIWWMAPNNTPPWSDPVDALLADLENQINFVKRASNARRAAIREMLATHTGFGANCPTCKGGGFAWVQSDGEGHTTAAICHHNQKFFITTDSYLEDDELTWGKALKVLEARLPAQAYTSWLIQTEMLGYDEDTALIRCANAVHAQWLERHLFVTIFHILHSVIPVDPHQGLEMRFVWEVADANQTL